LLSYRLPSTRDQVPLRRRLTGLGLAVVVNVALLLVLLTLGVIPLKLPKAEPGLVVDLLPSPEPSPSRSPSPAAKSRELTPLPVPPKHLQRAPETPKMPTRNPITLIEMSAADFAASDISKLSKSGNGSGDSDSKVVGRGPNGEILYAAEWAREPSDAELSGYLPKNAPDGYGLIACRTIPQDRVDDCIELENNPPGSHLAAAVRQAAWQFRVRPPRKGGKELIGTWVRIRIDYIGTGG
jgi:protein TonB